VVNVVGRANDAIADADTGIIISRREILILDAGVYFSYFLDDAVDYSCVFERGADVGYQCQKVPNHKRRQCQENDSPSFTFKKKIIFPE
jgi:hypothetical protein